MNSHIFTYLRKQKISDTRMVNKLFVSAFIDIYKISQIKSTFLNNYIIKEENEEEYKTLHRFIDILKSSIEEVIDIEMLIQLFEFVISPEDRIVTGAVYTPHTIRKNIIETCLNRFTDEQLCLFRVADIACGCGAFLLDVASYLRKRTNRTYEEIFRDNIYGVDIQSYSVERTKILLSVFALLNGEDRDFSFNILNADTLAFCSDDWDEKYSSFDAVVGNPPYVCSRNVTSRTKEKMLLYEVCKSGHPDLYIPFFQIGIEMLTSKGVLGFITMNSFLKSVNGRALREYFSKNRYCVFIMDFRGYQIFKSKSTYTCLFFLDKGVKSESLHYVDNESADLTNEYSYQSFAYDSLDNKKGWNINNYDESHAVEITGIPLGKYCESRHGIATLSNSTYIFKKCDEDEKYYYLEKEELIYPIEKAICREVVNSNKLNSDVDFDSIKELLIFPYFKDNKGKMIVYSAETMKKCFPQALSYLESQKKILDMRDKGNTVKYPAWYAYGRTQSLSMSRYKLFFPKFVNKKPNCVLCDDETLMLYNGVAFQSNDRRILMVVKRIMESDIFWNYIKSNAKPYASGYYSLSGVDIKNFGIPSFSEENIETLLVLPKEKVNGWLEKFYHIPTHRLN